MAGICGIWQLCELGKNSYSNYQGCTVISYSLDKKFKIEKQLEIIIMYIYIFSSMVKCGQMGDKSII